MPNRWIGPAALLFSLAQATWTSASPQSSSGPAEQPKTAEAEPTPNIDVSRLPINLDRIQRRLRQSSVRDESDGLRLRYIVDVYGQAPRIELFTQQDNLLHGPVPYGGPTHRDLLQVITPQEHRAPAADFGNLFRWLSGKAKDRSDK
jgi:hypothetical protein